VKKNLNLPRMIIGFALVFLTLMGWLFLITHGKRKQSTPQRIAPNLPSPIIPHRGSCFFSLSFFLACSLLGW
jgi:hypothetical protein